jgi:formamidase
VPPRENGGNLDIKQLTAGSRLMLSVQVTGALVSFGDPHFAQGDGESCGAAIEMTAQATVRIGLRRADQIAWRPANPAYTHTAPKIAGRLYIATTGLSLDRDGSNRFLDPLTAARRALEELVDHLVAERGYSEEQAYVILSVAADLRISEIVNFPNALVSAALPLDIFESRQAT